MSASAHAAPVWEPFVIRTANNAQTPVNPVGTADGSSFTVTIDESSEKAGYGTSYFDGQKVGALTEVTYTRNDAGTKQPYLNFWITDGTNYAIIAPVLNMQSTGDYHGVDMNGADLQSLGFNIYETDRTAAGLAWLGSDVKLVKDALIHNDGTPVRVSELAGFVIQSPATFPSPPIGTGAPKNGNGFNLVFGDTQGNFTSPVPYSISNVQVPEPTALAVLGAGAAGLLLRRRRA